MFVNGLARKLGGILTADDMTAVLDTVSEQLRTYDMENVDQGPLDVESGELLNEFLAAKEMEGKSKKTIEHYRYIINRMFNTLNIPAREIMVFHLRRYLTSMREAGKADATIEGIRGVLCSFFGWVQREGLLPNNPAANLSPIRIKKKVRLPFSGSEIERLKEKCECSRDKAIIGFLYATGCRISEVCGLNRGDIDFTNRQCVVIGKGDKERTVYMDDVSTMLLQRYLKSRIDDCEALFIGKGTERMTPGGIRTMLKKLALKANVENVHPHRFRRTLATTLIKHGMSIEEVAQILGHEKIDTTMKYIYIDQSNVKNSYTRQAS